MAEKYSKATQVGATGAGKGGRIYDTQKKATVTYKGSAKDLKFLLLNRQQILRRLISNVLRLRTPVLDRAW